MNVTLLADVQLNTIGRGVGAICLYALVGLVLMVVGFYAVDLSTPGKLRDLVKAGKPNATYITAAGMLSMAFIIVVAIYASGGRLVEGVTYSLIYGLVGIIAQIVCVRVLDLVTGVDLDELMHADLFLPQARVIAACHVALGLIVAMAVF
ncbi:hypothetical protein TPAU25S_03108 [Tsukamurella paurometabola]|uniref:DUF350 domain-containing protein n=1 Tax=Tsukamurella paurometabola (strain ATCC 8368 / DSM 20162 / CCUG 35730 / CIP 100753 / JCM 10117 / KCTC 9821 / NBRC 16120 / NCIMB 702349 / NCTC 13040) TaxID=521096 RepID=D5UY88_TSUPD|nr:DUF350 domain-containing protein [Tsukamurella paurometabola]ADG78195.1 protein of unknown function DUF350 [Tsukamurella paurometabola DSM 20162]SUP30624.1 Predicted membrane protein [Tsukamurella paurometabola]